jgi:hypothetical protein
MGKGIKRGAGSSFLSSLFSLSTPFPLVTPFNYFPFPKIFWLPLVELPVCGTFVGHEKEFDAHYSNVDCP